MKYAAALTMVVLATSLVAFPTMDAKAKLFKKSPKPAQSATTGRMITTHSGLQYEDVVVGTGAPPVPGRKVVVHYTGWLMNGQKFDSSLDRGQPFSFVLGAHQVIKGWDEGVASMHIGGKRILVIPPQLAYGAAGTPGGPIPGNATLKFEVQLLGVQ